jgi:hypothetical protein
MSSGELEPGQAEEVSCALEHLDRAARRNDRKSYEKALLELAKALRMVFCRSPEE